MADIVQQRSTQGVPGEQKGAVKMPSSHKLQQFTDDQENMSMSKENREENSEETVTVWSPPNTPPNKFNFPKFPSLSPLDVNIATSRDTKTTPPRGRPKADMITHLIVEGTQSCSPIRCDICSRVFPREKSLQAHKRTHSGHRPYLCDFPNCEKAFVQSGQLKTHQRLHTGEKPFICTVHGCTSRFTHANRHCSLHPKAGLVRQDSEVIPLKKSLLEELQDKEASEQTKTILSWLEKYESERQNKSPSNIIKPKRLKEHNNDRITKTNVSERRRSRLEAKRRLAEQKERWFGALALVQLAEINAKDFSTISNFNLDVSSPTWN